MTRPLRFILPILMLALALRILGIWHGYPYSWHGDEMHLVKRALSFASGDLNPHWFHKPAFFMYLLFFDFGLLFLGGMFVGLWQGVQDFGMTYILKPGVFFVAGRLLTTAFSLASIWAVYEAGRRHFSKEAGLLGALLLALSLGHIASAQDVKEDTAAAFFAILSAWLLLDYLKLDDYKRLILSVAAAGAGTAVKLYPAVMLAPVVLAILLKEGRTPREWRASWKKVLKGWALTAGVFVAVFFICSPFSFLDPLGREQTFGRFYFLFDRAAELMFGIERAAQPDDHIAFRMGGGEASLDYLKVLLQVKGMGPVIGAISLAGYLMLLIRQGLNGFLFAIYPLLLFVISIMTAPGYAEVRHQLPIYPFLALGGGLLLAQARTRLALRPAPAAALLLLLMAFPLYAVINRGVILAQKDTRNIAKEWIETNIPEGASLVADENGPVLMASERQLRAAMEEARKIDSAGQFTTHYDRYLEYKLAAASVSKTYDLFEIRFPWWRSEEPENGAYRLTSDYDRDMGNPLKPVGVESYDHYHTAGYSYAVVESERYQMFIDSTEFSERFPSYTRFYRDLFARGELVHEVPKESSRRPGPTVRIYRIR